jgi:hypothetical protein
MNYTIHHLIDFIPDWAFQTFAPLVGLLFLTGLSLTLHPGARRFAFLLMAAIAVAVIVGFAFFHIGAAYFMTPPAEVSSDAVHALAQVVGYALQPLRLSYVVSAITLLSCIIFFSAAYRPSRGVTH